MTTRRRKSTTHDGYPILAAWDWKYIVMNGARSSAPSGSGTEITLSKYGIWGATLDNGDTGKSGTSKGSFILVESIVTLTDSGGDSYWEINHIDDRLRILWVAPSGQESFTRVS